MADAAWPPTAFLANAGTFSGFDNVDDVTWQVTGRNGFSDAGVFDAASTAGIRIEMITACLT